MGITLLFMKVEDGDKVDADKAAVARLLEQRGLRVVEGPDGGQIVTHDGQPLTFDGSPSDMFLGHLDDPEPLIGAISHATLTAQECEFVYDLCVAGDHTYELAARELGVTHAVVRNRLSRLRSRLRADLRSMRETA